MNLLKTSFFTSISQVISILSGLVAVKVISSRIGPEGMAMTGQFYNITGVLTLFATAAVGLGIVKYLAEYTGDKERQFKVIRTGFWLTVVCSLLVGIFSIFFATNLSKQAFKTEEYKLVYILWGSFLVINTLSSFCSSLLNGLKLIKILTIVTIFSTLVGLLMTILFAHYYGVLGVLISSNFTALCLFILHLFFIKKYKWFSWRELLIGIDREILKLFSGFMLMAVVSGILAPSLQLIIRNKIINDFSFTEAGHWQSVTRISDYYLGFVISVLGIYYLPRLSEIKHKNELRQEVIQGYKIILPALAMLSFSIWMFRHLIIKILLTKEFEPAASLFGFQFLGDFFKMGAWLLAYLMPARGLKTSFIITELVYSVVYVLLTFYFLNTYGIIGSVYGFCLSYLLYAIAIYFVIKKQKII